MCSRHQTQILYGYVPCYCRIITVEPKHELNKAVDAVTLATLESQSSKQSALRRF